MSETAEHTTCLLCYAYAGPDGLCSRCRARLSPHTVPNVLGERRTIVLEQRAKAEECRLETERRKRNHELAMQRIREDKERRDREVAQAREDGVCVLCYVRGGHRKRIRHRTPNYHVN